MVEVARAFLCPTQWGSLGAEHCTGTNPVVIRGRFRQIKIGDVLLLVRCLLVEDVPDPGPQTEVRQDTVDTGLEALFVNGQELPLHTVNLKADHELLPLIANLSIVHDLQGTPLTPMQLCLRPRTTNQKIADLRTALTTLESPDA